MFDKADCDELKEAVLKVCHQSRSPRPNTAVQSPARTPKTAMSRSGSNRATRVNRLQDHPGTARSVWLGVFLGEICRQQTQKHEDFLSSFTKLFKSQDTDLDGIINDEQFFKLIDMMNIGVPRE